MIQTVILAGGAGTRLGSISRVVPKSMLRINGIPFLEHQMDLLKRHGLKKIVLCVGYLAEQIIDYFGHGAGFGMSIQYSCERGILLGTGGALKFAEPLLEDRFLLLYGHAYHAVNYDNFIKHYEKIPGKALLAAYSGNKEQGRGKKVFHNLSFGLAMCTKDLLCLIPPEGPYSMEDLFMQLMKREELEFYHSGRPHYEIGSLEGLLQLRKILTRMSHRMPFETP